MVRRYTLDVRSNSDKRTRAEALLDALQPTGEHDQRFHLEERRKELKEAGDRVRRIMHQAKHTRPLIGT